MKNIFDFFLSDKCNQAEAKAGLTDSPLYKASFTSPLNSRVNWDWPFPNAVVPAARNRNPTICRPNTDHLELISSVSAPSDTSFTDLTVLPSHFCEDMPDFCNPAAAKEFYNTSFEPELITLLNDTDADVTAAISVLDTESSAATAGNTSDDASITNESTSLKPSSISLTGTTNSISTADYPIVDPFTTAPETTHGLVPMTRTALKTAPSSYQPINRSMIITPPYSIESIDLTDSPPNPTVQINKIPPVSEAKRTIFVSKAKLHASVANDPATGTTKRTPQGAFVQRKPRTRTPNPYSTPTSSSPQVLRRIAPTPPASVNDVVCRISQEVPPHAPLNPITPMSIEAQQQLYEQKYLRQQSNHSNQQQNLKDINQTFQNNHRQEYINREQQMKQTGQHQQYQQLPKYLQPHQFTQPTRRDLECANYLQPMQPLCQQQTREQMLQSMQAFQSSRQLTEDERQPNHLQPNQHQAQQSAPAFTSALPKTEHEQHLLSMQMANQQQQYSLSPQWPQTPQMAQELHSQRMQQTRQQQIVQKILRQHFQRQHARRQIAHQVRTPQPAGQQMTQEQHQRYLQNQTRQQNAYQLSPTLGQPTQPTQLNQLLPQLACPTQQMQGVPLMQVAHQAGPAYGHPYPAQKLQTQHQVAYLAPPAARQSRYVLSVPAFHYGAGHILLPNRMQSSPAPSSKRGFEFVDNDVPQNFEVTPENLAQWYLLNPSRDDKVFLNEPKAKKARTALKS
jgi:hypothetical protein